MTDDPIMRPWQADASPPRVTAILVSRNGRQWLPEMLASLRQMELAPSDWHAVDVASGDGSAEMLRAAFGDSVSYVPSGTGFGTAVKAGLEHCAHADWIWLLHDDMIVTESTLAELVNEAMSSPDIAVTGPKVREWPSLRRLLDVGLTVTGTAHRETQLEPGEPDAGQHDRPVDVLAVGSAGILIRLSVWNELGGFDEDIPLFFDDIDFGWRVNNAGYRVRTAPAATCFHAQASAAGSRPAGPGDVTAEEKRRAALYTVLVNTNRFWWQYLRLAWGSVLRCLGFLFIKDPGAARDELWALTRVYSKTGGLLRGRKQRIKPAPHDVRRVRGLLPVPWLPYVRAFETVTSNVQALLRPDQVVSGGRRSSGADAAYRSPKIKEKRRFWSSYPWLTTLIVLTLMSLIAARGVLFGGPLHGGALSAAPDSIGHWWHLFFDQWHHVGLGSHQQGPAYVLILAVLALPVWFAPGVLVAALIIFCVPLAAATAYWFACQLSPNRGVRAALALTYASAIAASGSLAQGRIGTIVALVLLPVVGLALLRFSVRPSWRAGLILGFITAVSAAFAPLMYVFVAVISLAVALASVKKPSSQVFGDASGESSTQDGQVQSASGSYWKATAMALIIPWPLLGPWLWTRFVEPLSLWAEAGKSVDSQATIVDLVFGRAGGNAAGPGWLSIGLIVLAIIALIPRQTRKAVMTAWAVALLGLAFAAWGFTAELTPDYATTPQQAWIGLAAVLWLSGLASAIVLASPELLKLSRPKVIIIALLVVTLPAGTAVWWLGRGIDDPLERGPIEAVPVYVADQSGIAVVMDGSISDGMEVSAVYGDGLRLGDEAVRGSKTEMQEVIAGITDILSSSGSGGVKVLADLGIQAIYAPQVDPEIARRLDAQSDLSPAGSDTSGSRVWSVDDPAKLKAEPSAIARSMLQITRALIWVLVIVLVIPGRRRAEVGGR